MSTSYSRQDENIFYMDDSMTEIKKYYLENLDCATCAAKIEDGVSKMPGVRFAKVNFATSTLHLDSDNHEDDVQARIKELEPDVRLKTTQEKEPLLTPEARRGLMMILAALVLFILGLVFNRWLSDTPNQIGRWLVFGAAYLITGYPVLLQAVRNLRHGNWFDETFLMSISTIGAIAIGELPEAVGVMLFYQIGEFIQQRSVSRSRNLIQSLMDVKPESATVVGTDGSTLVVMPQEVQVGQIILVQPGERIPLDGTVREGSSRVDASMLTGESVPVGVEAGSPVFAGTVNQGGVLTVEVTKSLDESSISRMLDLVQNATERKAKTERFITKFAKWYSPAMVALALAVTFLPPLLIPGEPFQKWLYRALVILVVSCPCALVVSIPLGYFGGVGGASRRGILVKGANYLDVLAKVRTVIFDKTGTLTKGDFSVTEIVPQNGFTADELLRMAVEAETHSSHPVAGALREAYVRQFGEEANPEPLMDYEEVAGFGVRARSNGSLIHVGNDAFMHREGIEHTNCDMPGTVVYLAVDGHFYGHIVVADEIKPEAKAAVEELHRLGVENVMMLSGDKEDVAQRVAAVIGLDSYQAELLPEDKLKAVEETIAASEEGTVAFVGDGINDAPALARADVGIAMGAFGTDAAKETADVVLMTDTVTRVADAVRIGRRTRRIVWQNIVLALGIKALFISLGIAGEATMWEAVFGDVGVTILAVLNSTRVLKS